MQTLYLHHPNVLISWTRQTSPPQRSACSLSPQINTKAITHAIGVFISMWPSSALSAVPMCMLVSPLCGSYSLIVERSWHLSFIFLIKNMTVFDCLNGYSKNWTMSHFGISFSFFQNRWHKSYFPHFCVCCIENISNLDPKAVVHTTELYILCTFTPRLHSLSSDLVLYVFLSSFLKTQVQIKS